MYEEILKFWFDEIDPSQWWAKDDHFDRLLAEKFSAVHARATRCELFEWRVNAKGRLAEIIVLDQFSRNMFRDLPSAFVNDPLALALSQEAISAGMENQLTAKERNFLYMPFTHNESLQIHEVAIGLFKKMELIAIWILRLSTNISSSGLAGTPIEIASWEGSQPLKRSSF